LSETELPNKTTQYCWPSRPATFLIGPGTLRRWELKIMPGETPEEFTNPSRIRQAMTPYVDMDAFEIWRSATYRFNARVGIDWRKGRVILAGDAVHQTPPFLGQGLCAGVRDAINLAWKIVHIQRTGYNDRLLDSYQEERRPHVGTLIQHAKEFGAIIGELDEARARQRDADLSAQLATGQVETKRQGFIPNLETGLIGPPPEGDDAETFAGTLMVQPTILDPSGTEVLLDDHAPMEFLFITDSPEQQQWMDDVADVWTRLGGLRMVIATEAGSKPAQVENGIEYLRDTGDTLARWQDRANASAVLVRPDRYVYATVTDRADLVAKVGRLADVLLPS
jgi:3-(3-hydroxy-phenyl)propionate hydroxylase